MTGAEATRVARTIDHACREAPGSVLPISVTTPEGVFEGWLRGAIYQGHVFSQSTAAQILPPGTFALGLLLPGFPETFGWKGEAVFAEGDLSSGGRVEGRDGDEVSWTLRALDRDPRPGWAVYAITRDAHHKLLVLEHDDGTWAWPGEVCPVDPSDPAATTPVRLLSQAASTLSTDLGLRPGVPITWVYMGSAVVMVAGRALSMALFSTRDPVVSDRGEGLVRASWPLSRGVKAGTISADGQMCLQVEPPVFSSPVSIEMVDLIRKKWAENVR